MIKFNFLHEPSAPEAEEDHAPRGYASSHRTHSCGGSAAGVGNEMTEPIGYNVGVGHPVL